MIEVGGNRDRPRHEPIASPAIQIFLNDRTDDPGLQRRLATQSRLPNSNLHKANDYHGLPKDSIGTSMLLSGSDHTRTNTSLDLAALTRTSSLSNPESVPSSMGARQLANLRIFDEGPGGELLIPQLRTPQILECPFNLLFCFMAFSSLDEWINHSLSHFKNISPSTSNICCFCEAIFRRPSGMSSWKDRMHHVALHHQLGHKLAHAQPDFELFTYLWNNRLISDTDYKDLKGNSRDRSRTVAAYPTTQASQNRSNAPYTETNSPRRRDRYSNA